MNILGPTTAFPLWGNRLRLSGTGRANTASQRPTQRGLDRLLLHPGATVEQRSCGGQCVQLWRKIVVISQWKNFIYGMIMSFITNCNWSRADSVDSVDLQCASWNDDFELTSRIEDDIEGLDHPEFPLVTLVDGSDGYRMLQRFHGSNRKITAGCFSGDIWLCWLTMKPQECQAISQSQWFQGTMNH